MPGPEKSPKNVRLRKIPELKAPELSVVDLLSSIAECPSQFVKYGRSASACRDPLLHIITVCHFWDLFLLSLISSHFPRQSFVLLHPEVTLVTRFSTFVSDPETVQPY